MKNFLFLTFFISSGLFAQQNSPALGDKISNFIVETGCGKCCFKSSGMKKCALAVKIDGKIYPVDGKKLNDFGKPKLKHGLCRKIRKAEVSGEIVNNRFLAFDFKVLPVDKSEMQMMEEGQQPAIENKM